MNISAYKMSMYGDEWWCSVHMVHVDTSLKVYVFVAVYEVIWYVCFLCFKLGF